MSCWPASSGRRQHQEESPQPDRARRSQSTCMCGSEWYPFSTDSKPGLGVGDRIFAAGAAGRGGVGPRCTSRNCSPWWKPDQMPWTSDDAERHKHKATTRALKELWAKVANKPVSPESAHPSVPARSGGGRLTEQTPAVQPLVGNGSSCPEADLRPGQGWTPDPLKR